MAQFVANLVRLSNNKYSAAVNQKIILVREQKSEVKYFMHLRGTYITHFTKQGSFSKRWDTFTLCTYLPQGCGDKKNRGGR